MGDPGGPPRSPPKQRLGNKVAAAGFPTHDPIRGWHAPRLSGDRDAFAADRREGFHSQLDGSNLKAGTSLSSSDD